MTESSRSRVTVTLERDRRVVRRAGDASDGSYKQSTLLIGRKSSVRDRLGEDAESSLSRNGPMNSKRFLKGSPPPRSGEDMHRVPAMWSLDDARFIAYMSKDVLEPPRPDSTNAVYLRNPTHPTFNTRPPQPVLGQPPPSPAAVVQRSSFMIDEHQTVDGLLQALGLGKYAILFKAEEVDMTTLKKMGESDLKEIGIPMS